jgi:hypothetical protein
MSWPLAKNFSKKCLRCKEKCATLLQLFESNHENNPLWGTKHDSVFEVMQTLCSMCEEDNLKPMDYFHHFLDKVSSRTSVNFEFKLWSECKCECGHVCSDKMNDLEFDTLVVLNIGPTVGTYCYRCKKCFRIWFYLFVVMNTNCKIVYAITDQEATPLAKLIHKCGTVCLRNCFETSPNGTEKLFCSWIEEIYCPKCKTTISKTENVYLLGIEKTYLDHTDDSVTFHLYQKTCDFIGKETLKLFFVDSS